MHAPRRRSSGRPLPPHLVRAATLLAVLTVSLGAVPEARAACTTAICAPATGACAINGGPHKIDNGCTLDFDGRDVTLNGTLDIDDGAVTIRARNFTVASGGLIDGSPQGGFITILATGGNIFVQSSAQRGIDMIGQDQGGAILLDATGNVTIDGRLKANNGTTALDASGGSIELRAGGNLRISGSSDVDASGGRQADGGSVDFLAVGRIDIEKDVLVSGGEGGDVTLEAGDELLLNGRIVDDSTGGGGSGGFVDIAAEKTITVGKSIRSAGSTSTDLFGGDGGFLTISSAAGDVIVRDEITVQSGAPDGGGGEIEIFAARSVKLQAGRLNARGEGIESFAGTIFLDSDLDVTIGALVDSSGGGEGGGIEIGAGRNVEIANTLDVRARQPATFSGSVIVDAGILEGGAVTVKAAANQAQAGRILANGAGCLEGVFCSVAGTVDLNGCDVTVEGTDKGTIPGLVDASAPGADGAGGGIAIVARRQLTVGIGARLNATGSGTQGTIELVFPQSRPPVLGQSIITPLTPASSIGCTEANCPENNCPPGDAVCQACRPLCFDFCDCGDGRVDEFEQCDTSAQGCDTGAGQVCGVTDTFRECVCIATCGNGAVDLGEQCDGAQNGSTCRTLGFFNTTPVPCVSCAFDTSQCTAGTCGDGVLAPRNELDEKGLPGFFEVCDGTDVGAESCVSLGFTRGTLACKADCSGFNVGSCQVGRCGDGVPDAGEACDDGNRTSGDCCSSTCTADTAGAPCGSDKNLCTDDRCNGIGICLHVNNTVPCDDGNLCTQSSSCVAGTCTGSNPVVCTPIDACHVAGVCNPATGLCSNPLAGDGTTCNDGDQCTQSDTCEAGSCFGSNPVVCTASDDCHTAGICDPASGSCSHPAKPDGAACDDGDLCTQSDTCQAGICTGANPVVCTSGACHDAGVCNPATGVCSRPAKPNGTACDDGNACTQTDTCQAGLCVGTNPVVCSTSDQCHVAGVCNPATGMCSDPAKPDGTACNDGNLCTNTDTCQVGVCTGADPVVCTALDQCHVAGVCDPSTGICSDPTKPDGTACDDGTLCTRSDTCVVGVCAGADPVVCTADQCHAAGTCNPATGLCANPPTNEGQPCDDGNACTRSDTCQAGSCVGADPVVCTAVNECHTAGVCDPATGVCSTPERPDGTACDDGDACTQSDTCQAGSCVGMNPVVCTVVNQCHTVGTCDPATGVCSTPVRPDNTPCNDGNLCTGTDTCQTGVCVGTNPIVCTALDQCHVAGVCDPATGQCSNPNVANGAACNDQSLCTSGDSCQAGVCTGTGTVCTPLDQCHVAGVCDPATGICSDPMKPDGTACDDGTLCTRSDTCVVGVCAGADPVVCTADQCHAAGTCNPATGLCAKPATNEGQPCDDGNACTRSDTCQTGSCAGADPVICTAVNQCHEVGTCTPATGVCSTPDLPDGTACDDGDACTQSQCREGQCAGKFGVGADIVCSAHSLLVAPCGADQVPKALQKFIEGKVNSARTLLQKADEAALKGGKEAKIKKLRTKVIKVLNKISKKAAKFVNASKPEQSISEACKGQIDSLVQQRQQLIGAFVF